MLNQIVKIELFICVKMDYELNNQQRFICHQRKQIELFLHFTECKQKSAEWVEFSRKGSSYWRL